MTTATVLIYVFLPPFQKKSWTATAAGYCNIVLQPNHPHNCLHYQEVQIGTDQVAALIYVQEGNGSLWRGLVDSFQFTGS